MKIIVCVKQVPDTAEVKIDPVTNNLVREGVPGIMNPYDEAAVMMALRLKEQTGGTVSVLSMGPEQAGREIENALHRGADEGYLLCDRRLGGADTLATGYTLAETIRRLGCDLVLCGNEAVDGCTGQVGPLIGEFLQILAMTYITDMKIEQEGLRCYRDTGKYVEVYQINGPAVVCISNKQLADGPYDFREKIPAVHVLDAGHLEEEKIGRKGSPTRVAAISVRGREQNYLKVDYHWDCETRIAYIMNGGLEKKKKNLNRENKTSQAGLIMDAIMKK